MGTELDILVIGNYFLIKEDQNKSFAENYKDKYNIKFLKKYDIDVEKIGQKIPLPVCAILPDVSSKLPPQH